MAAHLDVPEDFTDWHWATQLNQARAIQYALEHYRSWWPRTAGAIVWQLNDCWPVTSWAAVDGDGRRKPLWYAMKHAFADRIVTVQPRGTDLVAALVNDTDEPWTGQVEAVRTTLGGEVLAASTRGTGAVTVGPRSVTLVPLPVTWTAVADAANEVLVVTLGEARGLHRWAESKDLALDPAPGADHGDGPGRRLPGGGDGDVAGARRDAAGRPARPGRTGGRPGGRPPGGHDGGVPRDEPRPGPGRHWSPGRCCARRTTWSETAG